MALTSPHLLQQSWPSSGCGGGIRGAGACSSPIPSSSVCLSTPARRKVWVSAVALDAASPPASVSGVRWGFSKLQGMRSEMEDDLVVRTEGLGGFSFAAVFDGHAGFSSVEYLRDELYKECLASLQGGLLLNGRNFGAIKDALQKAFEDVDSKLLVWLEETRNEDESGSTATVIFLQNDFLVISHVGDSCVALSRRGKAEALTNPHRPFGNNKVSLAEVKRIRAAGGWISDGRICGEIAVSRAFGDIRFKTKKNEILDDGVKEGRLSEKFVSRVQFKGDLVVSTPDVYQVDIGSDVEFVVLASDGLWDYMKSSEVIDFVRNELRQHGDAQMACEALAHAALDRRSEDNISIVIADMGRTDWLNLPVQRTNIVYELSQAFATIGIVSLGIWISSNMSM